MPLHLLQIAKKLAHDAGKLALDYQKRGFTTETKNGPFELVTEADKACEDLILSTIKKNFPDHTILSEESGMTEGDSEYKWIVDPIDGTTNFAHGMPIFGISIAIVHKGMPIIGVVEIPGTEETFHAKKGEGAFRNGKQIQVSRTTNMGEALLATGFPFDRNDPLYKANMRIFEDVYNVSRGVRRFGAASIDLCYTACGRLDAYWEFGLKPWDIAAGKIIIEEAGGMVTNTDGSMLNPKLGRMLASNGQLHSRMMELIGHHAK